MSENILEHEDQGQQVAELMQAFWQSQYQKVDKDPIDFKFHQLPLARIKKVMKSDEDVKSMVSLNLMQDD